jgi:exodeoxyribonuclease VII large subunit
MQQDSLSLLELNMLIKGIISENTAKCYWVTGEVAGLKVNTSGHCYLELIQKDEDGGMIVARNRAIIWAQKFRLIKPYFETTTGQMLTDGINILVKVSIEYHEVYGLSLGILDIEPAFTVGEMALRRQKIIERLITEGVVDMNKEIQLPRLCQKIAVISSATAAGFEDFREQLLNNPYGYIFYLKLFPAAMQGDEAEPSIIAALDRIYRHESFFDAVAIIRGGGSQTDLNCFNNYWLAYNVTQFPLPVLTGIGHEQDDSVVDLVANTRLKTPTAVAAFLTDRMANLEAELNDTTAQLIGLTRESIESGLNILNRQISGYHISLNNSLVRHRGRLMQYNMHLQGSSRQRTGLIEREIERKVSKLVFRAGSVPHEKRRILAANERMMRQSMQHKLKRAGQNLEYINKRLPDFDPQKVLERGYSITMKEGVVVKDASLLDEDERIETILYKGRIESVIKRNKK